MHPLLSGWYLGERLREAAAPPALVSIGGFFLLLMGLVRENGCDCLDGLCIFLLEP